MRIFWYLLMELSVLGFVLSAVVQFFALRGAPLSAASYMLQLGLFIILSLPYVFRSGGRNRYLGRQRERDWENFKRGCPRPLKVFYYGLSIYAALNVVLWILKLQHIGGTTLRRLAPDPFSAFWMCGYVGLAIYYYLAAHPPAPAQLRLCPEGHALPSGTLACAQCVSPVVPPIQPPQAPTTSAALALPTPLKRGVLYLVMGAAEFGFVLSLIVYGAALLAIPIPETAMALHKALFFIWPPTVIVVASTLPQQARSQWWHRSRAAPPIFEPSPEWMRWLAGGLYANFVLNMALLMVNSPPRGAPRGAGPLPYHLFASGWMVFYYVALFASYAALRRLSATDQRCPHGQDISPTGSGCAACGLRVPLAPDT